MENLTAAEEITVSNADKVFYKNFKFISDLNGHKKVYLSKTVTKNTGKVVTLAINYPAVTQTWFEPYFRILTENGGRWELIPGVQTVDMVNKRVSVEAPHFSLFRLAQWVEAAAGLNNVVVFPNPVDFSTSVNKTMKFFNLTPGPTINIYTVSGERISTIEPGLPNNDGISGKAEWDGQSSSGAIVRGIYIYTIRDSEGKKAAGKFVVK